MKKVFLICHRTAKAGGLDNLLQFLRDEGCSVSTLLHPLDNYSALPTAYEDDDGNVTNVTRANRGMANYVEDFMYSLKYLKRTDFDTFIGCNNFDTLPAVFARLVLRRRIGKIIYFPRDYSEGRFGNKLMNFVYAAVEKIACRYSDVVVSNTKRAEAARHKLGLDLEKSVIIPNPVLIPRPLFKNRPIRKTDFIYVGDVSKEHGLYDLVRTITPYISKLVIIGGGKDWDRTVAYAERQDFTLELHQNKPREFVIEYLQGFSGIGLAPYNLESRWTYYCSPLKVGEYIACGVPVLMSDVPEIAEEIQNKGYGITYHVLDIEELRSKIESFNARSFSSKAKSFYESMNANKLYRRLSI